MRTWCQPRPSPNPRYHLPRDLGTARMIRGQIWAWNSSSRLALTKKVCGWSNRVLSTMDTFNGIRGHFGFAVHIIVISRQGFSVAVRSEPPVAVRMECQKSIPSSAIVQNGSLNCLILKLRSAIFTLEVIKWRQWNSNRLSDSVTFGFWEDQQHKRLNRDMNWRHSSSIPIWSFDSDPHRSSLDRRSDCGSCATFYLSKSKLPSSISIKRDERPLRFDSLTVKVYS